MNQVRILPVDVTRNHTCHETANQFSNLCALRGVSGVVVEWKDHENSYYCNNVKCGPSIHGCYEWLNKQPNVMP